MTDELEQIKLLPVEKIIGSNYDNCINEIQPSSDSACSTLDEDDVFKIPQVPERTVTKLGECSTMQEIPEFNVTQDIDESIQSSPEDEEDDEWEDSLIYVDMDDIPNVEELFAAEPDDFIVTKGKRPREDPSKTRKPIRSGITLKFYNLDDKNPILQIGDRFYTGRYEEALGSQLFFRAKKTESNSTTPDSNILKSLVPEMTPPPHPVFGEHNDIKVQYELVANVNKVLKMTRRNFVRDVESTQENPLLNSGSPVEEFRTTESEETASQFVPAKTVDLKCGLTTSYERNRKRDHQTYLKGIDSDDEESDQMLP